MYEEENENIKGKPKMPGYKTQEKTMITFTKYAIRREKREIKLSISKKMQEEFKVKSLNFLIPKKLEKLINLESIKMIRMGEIKNGEIKMYIIYEKEEKKLELGGNTRAIDLGMDNLDNPKTFSKAATADFEIKATIIPLALDGGLR